MSSVPGEQATFNVGFEPEETYEAASALPGEHLQRWLLRCSAVLLTHASLALSGYARYSRSTASQSLPRVPITASR